MFHYDVANTGHRPDGRGPTSDGTERWRVETGDSVRSSPAVVDGIVYVASGDAKLYAIEADGGQVEWTAELGAYSWSSPAVVHETVYVGGGSRTVSALSTDDGSERWQFDGSGSVLASPTVVDGSVYIGTSEGELYAIDANSGVEQWRQDLSVVTDTARRPTDPSATRLASGARSQQQAASETVGTVAAGDGRVYAATGNALYGLDGDTGDRRWSVQFDTYAAGRDGTDGRLAGGDTTGQFDRLQALRRTPSSPALVDGVVYVGQYPESVAVNAESGQRLWRADDTSEAGAMGVDPSGQRLQTAGEFASSPAVTDDSVYVGGDRLVALDRQSGSVNWGRSFSGPVNSSPVVVDGTVYVGTDDSRVVGFEAGSGNTVWSVDTDGSVVSSPAVADGTVYVGCLDGTVYAFE